MVISHDVNCTRWRPHHIFCVRFLPGKTSGRGEKFDRESAKIREMMNSGIDTVVSVTQGVDDLCMFCPDCKNNRCENPHGDEDQVLKWDARILKGLDISYGQRMTIKELRTVIEKMGPLDFCRQRCPWRSRCLIFSNDFS
jgi:hypothetical protein